MRRRTFRAALAAAAVALVVAGCGGTAKNSGTGPIDPKAFDSSPCDVYRDKGLLALIKPELARLGWPQMATTTRPPGRRSSAHVLRCMYTFIPDDQLTDGDQNLQVTVYNEKDDGASLMRSCKQRPVTGPQPVARIGDESCLDDAGQWRFRVGTRYASVLVTFPARRAANGDVVTSANTRSFVPPTGDNERAALSEVVATDLAKRLPH